jgi:hypothetical protein
MTSTKYIGLDVEVAQNHTSKRFANGSYCSRTSLFNAADRRTLVT